MPRYSGHEIHSAQVSTDDSVANLKDIKTDLIDNIVVNRGRRTVEQTTAGPGHVGNIRARSSPSVRINFVPNSDDDRSMDVLYLGNDGPRAFDFQFRPDDEGTEGFRTTGLGLINDDQGVQLNHDTQIASAGVTLVPPQGSTWAFSDTVVA